MKKKVLLLSIIGIVLVGITISFAYWQIILSQESTNLVNSDCFEIEFLSGGATTNRETCFNQEQYYWNTSILADCKNNNWLYDTSNYQWALISASYSAYAYRVWGMKYDGYTSGHDAFNVFSVRPTLYLKSNLKIMSGDGTMEAPYELNM